MLLPLLFSKHRPRRRWSSFGITLLLVYFLLFSAFALFHAYAANELTDSHGCDIGQWIHLGQQAAASFLLVLIFLLLFGIEKSPAFLFVNTLSENDHPKRGPPRLALLSN